MQKSQQNLKQANINIQKQLIEAQKPILTYQGAVTKTKPFIVISDYGHHPNEIKATILAAKNAWPESRVAVVFQPHRYTRTRDLMKEFADVLLAADVLVLLEIYSAGEAEIPGVSSQALVDLINKRETIPAKLISIIDNLGGELRALLQPGDIVLFQGAGSVGQMAKLFISPHG